MKKVLDAIVNLLKVKTIITLAITGLFVYLSIKGQLEKETIAMVIVMVFTYYFNKKDSKEK